MWVYNMNIFNHTDSYLGIQIIPTLLKYKLPALSCHSSRKISRMDSLHLARWPVVAAVLKDTL
jgi:hypothetical protein